MSENGDKNNGFWGWSAVIFGCLLLIGSCNRGGGSSSSSGKIGKITKAKAIVKRMVNYPDTLSFHNMSTSVSGNNVTLKFTAKNAFGVPSTYTKTVTVR